MSLVSEVQVQKTMLLSLYPSKVMVCGVFNNGTWLGKSFLYPQHDHSIFKSEKLWLFIWDTALGPLEENEPSSISDNI